MSDYIKQASNLLDTFFGEIDENLFVEQYLSLDHEKLGSGLSIEEFFSSIDKPKEDYSVIIDRHNKSDFYFNNVHRKIKMELFSSAFQNESKSCIVSSIDYDEKECYLKVA